MKPEPALVIALARGAVDLNHFRVDRDLDWGLCGDLAATHQVDALCSWMCRELSRARGDESDVQLQEGFKGRLRLAYLHHLVRNDALVRDLADIHDALRIRGIEALYFKGPWLAFQAYPDPGTRPVGDIDLGIREENYREVIDALKKLSYRPSEPLPETPADALKYAHYVRQVRLLAPGRRPVELHFRLINMGPPASEERWVWETARPVLMGSRSLRVPGPEAMLLHVLLHANQHGFSVLRLLHDVRWALERDGSVLDEEELVTRIHDLRCGTSVYHGLLLARDLAGARVPQGLLGALRPSRWRLAVFMIAWQLPAIYRLESRKSRPEIESPLLYFLEMGRMRDKMRYLAGLLRAAGGVGPLIRRLLRSLSKSVESRRARRVGSI